MPQRPSVILLACPWCLTGPPARFEVLLACQIVQVGPLDAQRHESLPSPYCRYRCPACGWVEIQTHLLREPGA